MPHDPIDYLFRPPRYSEGTPWSGKILRISDDVRQCVVFLGWQRDGPVETAPIDPKGTGFFVTDPYLRGGRLVTAKHVAKKLHPPFVIRVNKKGGGAKLIHIERQSDIDWCYHPDETVDLAVAPVALPSWADTRGVRYEGLLDDHKRQEEIGAGDAVCVVGLFHFLHGTTRNLPVTHVGHIAMLPEDELILVDGTKREGYLIEANAISGCSGSPVFVSPSTIVRIGERRLAAGLAPECRLLGVWSASWKVRGSDIVTVKDDDDDNAGRLAPLGIGVVTPLSKLLELLNGDELAKATSKLVMKILAEGSASSDSLAPDPIAQGDDTRQNPQHKEDFTSLLNAATRKPKSGDKT